MSLDELKLLARLEELDTYTHTVVMQFPKFERHVLSAEIRACMAACLRLTVRAAKRYHKKTTLEDLDIELAFLRILVRKAHALGYISTHRYEVWIRNVEEAGRMLGGWLKSVR